MAFYDEDDEDNLNQDEEGGGVATSGQSSLITGGDAGAAAGSANAPDKSSNFVGLNQYLNANKPQAAKLGDQAAGVINNSANEAKNSVNSLNQAASEQIKPTQSLGSSIFDKLNQGAENLSQDEKSQLKSTAGAQYTGPKTVADFGDTYSNAQKATKTAAQNIDDSGTEQGRMNLITQVNNKPRTQGMNVFDNALLQAGGGREKIDQAAKANQDVKGSLDIATANIQNQIGRADDPNTPQDESAGAIGQTNKAKNEAYTNIQNALNNWKSSFTPKVTQAQNDLIGLQNRVQSDLQDNQYNLDQETLNLFGLNEGQQIFDTNLNEYLQGASPSDINASNVASTQDYARYAALADLAGEQDLMLKPEDAQKSGKLPSISVDKDRLMKSISDKNNKYQNEFNSLPVADFGAGPLTPKQLKEGIAQYRQIAQEPGMAGYYGRKADEMQAAYNNWEKNFNVNAQISKRT